MKFQPANEFFESLSVLSSPIKGKRLKRIPRLNGIILRIVERGRC